MTAVRIRGIYATALTAFLASEHEVVQVSEPIRARFAESFSDSPTAVEIETSDNRQGVSVAGVDEAVESVVTSLRRVGIDTMAWPDPVPIGAMFDGQVTETLDSGAVVDLGEGREGYLPYVNTDYVEEGDSVRVQVDEAVPPWSDDRPVLHTDAVVSNGLARLVRGGERTSTTTIDVTDMLPCKPRDGWAIRWSDRATENDVGFDLLAAAVTELNERVEHIDSASESVIGEPGRLTETHATTWVWFGRESRFALDEHRRSVTQTMAGHHRIKAGTDHASAAVDFAEAVCEPGDSFPFDVTTRQFGPQRGDRIALAHGKPDGRCIVLGRGEVTNYDPAGTITLERRMSPGGTYDALGVERRTGDVAVTKLKEGRWWYPTVYRGRDGECRGTYVNVCTPVELFPQEARYVDLHVDVVKHADGTTERVDDDELDAARTRGEVSEPLAEKARSVATAIERALEK